MNILVIQTDNRPKMDYLYLTKKVNLYMTKFMSENVYFKGFHYNYLFLDMNHFPVKEIHPATNKIYIMDTILNDAIYEQTNITSTLVETHTKETNIEINQTKIISNQHYQQTQDQWNDLSPFIGKEKENVLTNIKIEEKSTNIKTNQTKYDMIVFIDSDAWIQNPHELHDLIILLNEKENIHGAFSRDPYEKQNTFINSGSFIIKNNNFIKQMYKEIIEEVKREPRHHHSWPYDQYYISKAVHQKKDQFYIYRPDVLNTPIGKILRHNWSKSSRMYRDTYALLDIFHNKREPIEPTEKINHETELDDGPFPGSWDYNKHRDCFE